MSLHPPACSMAMAVWTASRCRVSLSMCLTTVAGTLIACLWVGTSHAQNFGGGGGGLGNQAVGGISIDADGIIQNLDPKVLESLAETRRRALENAPAANKKPCELRKVSLARLVATINQLVTAGKPLPAEVIFMGGLEQITHLFVDPAGHDIILAGPAGTAVVDAAGNILAAESRRPLLQLEDFIIALRSIDEARAGGMRCSIDPTPEGLLKLRTFLRDQKTIGSDPSATLHSMETVLGLQKITIGGVPAGSHFAHVLVAADYRMKRIGMGFEPSGLRELPSYLSMVPAVAASGTMLPRFWLEASYDPIARDPDELAWRISGRKMLCLTENDVLKNNGIQRGNAPKDAIAEKWCAAMTTHYEKLANKQPIFAELLNCVDLAVVAALIKGRQLDKQAGLDLSALLDEQQFVIPTYDVPASVPTIASGIKKGSRWVLSASGGVQFQPWTFATNIHESADLAGAHTQALASQPPVDNGSGWCWDN